MAKAPKGKPLKVVITRRTANGPVIDSVMESSAADAKRLIASAQDKDSTIGVDMAQPVQMAVTNDTFRSSQWALTTLRAESAWKFSVGPGVTVAVIDTGVQSNHRDLAGKVLKGYDVLAKGTPAADENGHGTHVAGIIAAIANNGLGIAGLTRGTRILPVRVLDAQGGGDTAGVAEGIIWATDHGAQVINMSLAAQFSDSATRSAVAYAISRNVVVVAAAGNDGCGFLSGASPSYPAAYPGVIGAGSIDSGNAKSSFSDCGSWVDVAAPGAGIWSTMIHNSNPELRCARTAYYCDLSGTSMATPYAAAAAALAIAEIGPRWSQAGVQAVLTSTATDLGSAGRDDSYGYGLINPVRTLVHIDSRISLKVPTHSTIAGDPVAVTGRLTLADGTALANSRVAVRSFFAGKNHAYALTTDSTGAFSVRVALPHIATFTATYSGGARVAKSSAFRTFTLVRPRWAYRHTSTRVYVTNYSIYGQQLLLQRRSGGRWATTASVKVTSKYWSAKAGKGTWRLRSVANSKLTLRASTAWTN